MRKYYDRANDRLIFEDEPATKDFWDRQWQTQKFQELVLMGRNERFVSPTTKKFLPANKSIKILEGGCGRGNYVYSLAKSGYDVYGIDYAQKTVRLVNKYFPELKIRTGDVRKIAFPNKFFDGYWSLGVIEHFYDGYDPILSEMKRVIKPGGYLFLAFPYISPLRRVKILFNQYEPFDPKHFPRKRFYQFVSNDRLIARHVSAAGFRLCYRKPYEGYKGLKDEVAWLKPIMQPIYDNQTFVNRLITYAISKAFAPFSSHGVLLVFERVKK